MKYWYIKNWNIDIKTLPNSFWKVGCWFNKLSDEKLSEYSWYPVEETKPTLEEYEKITKRTFELDDDWIIRNKDIIEKISLNDYKNRKYKEIKTKLAEKRKQGFLTSLEFKIDIMQENIGDWTGNLQAMQMLWLTETTVRDYNNITHTMSFEEYEAMMGEMFVYISWLYNTKWSMDEDIRWFKTYDEILKYKITY